MDMARSRTRHIRPSRACWPQESQPLQPEPLARRADVLDVTSKGTAPSYQVYGWIPYGSLQLKYYYSKKIRVSHEGTGRA
jgi:hypothetical protein